MASKSEFLIDDPNVKKVAAGLDAFGSKLHAGLRASGKHSENVIYSAFSVSTAMAMVKFGAEGTTATEIEETLGFPAEEVLGKAYTRVLTNYKAKNESFTLEVANGIFAGKDVKVTKAYVKNIKDFFLSNIKTLDFKNPKGAAATINAWINTATKGKIGNLMSPDSFDKNTQLVLASAIYFKGKWAKPFGSSETMPRPFYVPGGKKDVPMMHMTKKKFAVGTLKGLDARVLEMKYKGDRLAMLIYLPNSTTGLKKVEAGLKDLGYPKIMGALEGEKVEVEIQLPKFKMTSRMNLIPILEKMGISDAFDASADLGRIEQGTNLFISKVEQLALIEVNEEGTEAAAVTVCSASRKSAPKKRIKVDFIVNRPFYFQIVDHQTKFVLFAGSVVDPRK